MRARIILALGGAVILIAAAVFGGRLRFEDDASAPTAEASTQPRGMSAALSAEAMPANAAAAATQPAHVEHQQASQHERLARRAEAGDVPAALALAQLLDVCTEREETRLQLAALAGDWGPPPNCGSPARCEEDAARVAELQSALAMLGTRELDCRDIPREWLRNRGRWLLRAAESGDTESMACFALAGAELAPPPSTPGHAVWMARWREVGLSWAWEAWRRGDPRAALALARSYGPRSYFRGGADDLTEEDPRWHRRFALLLTYALALDPARQDLGAVALEAAATDAQRRDDLAWMDSELPRLRARLPIAARTPNACWQHFDMFQAKETESDIAKRE